MSAPRRANGKAHVLIVDDEPSTRSGLSRLLAAEGYSVETAESGKSTRPRARPTSS